MRSGPPGRATATACANIALVKYWGKRDTALNLPAAGSLSVTLDRLVTTTTVVLLDGSGDRLILGGREEGGEPLARVARFLDLVRARAGLDAGALVTSEASFPASSGLASSASAFAALALAASAAAGLALTPAELSALARRGSGSAARSIFGGFVEMRAGERPDGRDAHAVELLPPSAWDVRVVVAIVGDGAAKEVPSTTAMTASARTSPLHAAWLATVPADLAAARDALRARDLAALGEVAERSALAMHASALAARPGLVYWRGATVEAIHEVRRLRRAGVSAWFTIDAGPHVKVLTTPADAVRVEDALGAVPGVSRTLACRPGPGAAVVAAVRRPPGGEGGDGPG